MDLYNRVTTSMLFQKDLPGLVGYATNFRTNLGQLNNKGIEVTAKSNLNFGRLNWSIDANVSANRTRVDDLGGPLSFPPQGSVFGWNNAYQIKVGDPIGYIYGYQVQGIFKTQDNLTKYPRWNAVVMAAEGSDRAVWSLAQAVPTSRAD